MTILLLMTVGSMINLVPLYLYGNPETTTIFAGYLGFFLLGMACLAVGQFFSALTQNQIVAALITVSVLLGFWFVGHLQGLQNSEALRSLFGYLSFALHFADFVRGLVRSEGRRVLPGGVRDRADAQHLLPPLEALGWNLPSIRLVRCASE